jgi:hypothetical protein
VGAVRSGGVPAGTESASPDAVLSQAAFERPFSPLSQGQLEQQASRSALTARQAEITREQADQAARQRTAAAAARAARNAVRDPRGAVRPILAERGWGDQFGCLDSLWRKESGWNHTARNPSSGAFGIPQSLPASKMASAGADWRTNPLTQMRWGLDYIEDVYGSPCAAWAHSRASGWY